MDITNNLFDQQTENTTDLKENKGFFGFVFFSVSPNSPFPKKYFSLDGKMKQN